MKKTLLYIALLICSQPLQAQLFGKQDIGISQSFAGFHHRRLNNQSNAGGARYSFATMLDRNFHLKPCWSFQAGIGAGTHRNPDTLFRPFENNSFVRFTAGLLLHMPQKYSHSNWSPKRVNPYLKAGYAVDLMAASYRERTGTGPVSSFGTGAGLVYRISHAIGLQYEFMHHQRVTADYRSYFQHTFGFRINLDTPLLPY